MPATVIRIGDALALDFQNRITTAGVLDTTVSREYELTYDLGTFTGRRVDIYPLSYNPDKDDATRIEEYYDFRYAFVVSERYRDKGLVPKSWMDARVEFTQEYVFRPLDERIITTIDGIQYWSTETQVTAVFDPDFLRQHRVFWSEIETTFRKVSEGI